MITFERSSQTAIIMDDAIHAANSLQSSKSYQRFNRRGNIVARPSLSESVATSITRFAIQISFELGDRLEELIQLGPGWDGDDAKPLSPGVIGKALGLLGVLKRMRREFVLPFIAPTFSGQLLLEWTSEKRILEIETTPKGWSVVGTEIPLNGEREHFSAECPEFDRKILEFYDWFIKNELIWPAA